jgi:hypothetical protein
MEIMRRWKTGRLTKEEMEVASGATAHLHDNKDGKGAKGDTIVKEALEALQKWWDAGRTRQSETPPAPEATQAPRVPVGAPRAPRAPTAPRAAAVPRAPMQASWAQRAAEAAALPEAAMQRVGKKGKPVKEPTGLEPIKGSIPWDERRIAFERAAGAPQLSAAAATSAAGFVNVALSKVAPAHVRTEAFKISERGTLYTTARMGASASMLLQFKKEIVEAARRADKAIINVIATETWEELKILVPYGRYRGAGGLDLLREEIEAENQGVVIPPFSMRWIRARRFNEEQWQRGSLPGGKASVVFKVPNKGAGQKLLEEIWVAGNRFRAERFLQSKADTLCDICSMWGHSGFRCHSRKAACGICAGEHKTAEHVCEVTTCGKKARACAHTRVKCPNCRGEHLAQDGRCEMKRVAIGIARGGYSGTQQTPANPRMRRAGPPAADWTEIEAEIAEAAASTEKGEDTEMTSSGVAPPMTS